MGQASCKVACEKYAEHLEQTGQLCHQRPRESTDRWYQSADVDPDGCRRFPALPEPGRHPRLLFTEAEIPFLLARYTSCDGIGELLGKNLAFGERKHKENRSKTAEVSEEERQNPGKDTVIAYLRSDSARNDSWFLQYISAFINGNHELMEEVQDEVVFHCRLVLACAKIACEENLREKPFSLFQNNSFSVDHAFTLGGTALALCYDVMANNMSKEEIDTVRSALATIVKGRRSWGMDLPARRIQSNWSGYHGDLLAMTCVIEGEPGHDSEVQQVYAELMQNYINYGFYESGHPVEDSYALNVGLREGSIALVALARRGQNLFRHPSIKKMWRDWMPLALHPDPSGCIYGGPSGSELIYCTSVAVAKYMYPQDPSIDFVYRHYMCENGRNYSRIQKLQTLGHVAVFALPAQDEAMEDEHVHSLGVEKSLTFHCHDRGKVIMRSDWTTDAMWLTLDSRGDAFFIGHDAPSRGSFILNALGRNWSRSPEWRHFQESSDYSLPCIDGVGQKAKAPSVKMLDCQDGGLGGSTYCSADLTYAYNFYWTQWAKKHEEKRYLDAGWEREPHNPRDFGMTAYWLPEKLYDEPHVGFMGLFQMRKRFNTVQKITRSMLMVRDAPIPYALLADDCLKGDDAQHEYTWTMALCDDVELLSFDGTDIILGETKQDQNRRLVIRLLTACGEEEAIECNMDQYTRENKKRMLPDGTYELLPASRLTLKTTAHDAHFNLAFFPLEKSESIPPKTSWVDDNHLVVEMQASPQKPASVQLIEYRATAGRSGETTMRVAKSERTFLC